MEIMDIGRYSVAIEYHTDTDTGAPWIERDGHGIIEPQSARNRKAPGEIIIKGQYADYVYDFAATTAKAKAEGWGITGDTKGMTRAQITRAAVIADLKFCEAYLLGHWEYVGVVVTLLNADGEKTETVDSLWGIENYKDYHKEAARKLAQNLVDGHRLKDLQAKLKNL